MSAIYNRFYKMALKRLSTGANGVGIPIKITRGGDPTIDVTTEIGRASCRERV